MGKKYENSTWERSLVKGMVWEFFSFLITAAAVYAVYGNIGASLKFSLALTLVKVLLFFVHERAWKEVDWGHY